MISISIFLLLIMSQHFLNSIEKIEHFSDLNILILYLGNLIPFIITWVYLLKEINQIIQNKHNFIEKIGKEIIFIPRFNMFFCVFEYKSIEFFSYNGLYQLIDLKTFSLELDYENKKIRIFLFSKSQNDLLFQIQKVTPLLEALFPSIRLKSSSSLEKYFVEYSIKHFGDYTFLQKDFAFIQPQIIPQPFHESKRENIVIISCVMSDEDEENEFQSHTTQVYSISRSTGSSIFNFLGRAISIFQDTQSLIEENMLYRTIIRFQLNKSHLVSFKEGITYLQSNNTKINNKKEWGTIPEEQQQVSTSEVRKEHTTSVTYAINREINQICLELCNIYQNSNLIEGSKIKLCKKRTQFCQKLLTNPNFSKLLSELENENESKRKMTILTEVTRHLSYHQFYCLLAHFMKAYYVKKRDKEIVRLLHGLIAVKINMY